jgi:hypothetical protein
VKRDNWVAEKAISKGHAKAMIIKEAYNIQGG